MNRRRFRVSWLGIYFTAYIVLSLMGGYKMVTHGPEDNRSTWYPAYCASSSTGPNDSHIVTLNTLGWIYLPLMSVDQWFFHRTTYSS